MDIIVLAASIASAVYISNHAFSTQLVKTNIQRLTNVTASFSTALLGISVIETLPPTCLLLLSEEGVLSTKRMYQFLFAMITGLLYGIFPWVLSTTLISKLHKSKQTRQKLPAPWAIRILVWFLSSFITLVVKAAGVPYFLTIGKLLKTKRSKGNILARTKDDVYSKNNSFSTSQTSQIILLTSLAILSFYTAAHCIGAVVVNSSEKLPLLMTMVSGTCAIGILLSNLINGFASVSMPYSHLIGFFLVPVSKFAISQVREEQKQVLDSLKERRQQISQHESSLWSSTQKAMKDFEHLCDEVKFLDSLNQDMEADIVEMERSHLEAERARTPMGKVRSSVGFCFSAILVIRLLFSISFLYRVVHQDGSAPRPESDPVTRVILWLVGRKYVSPEAIESISQFVSLLLSAFLGTSQIRTLVTAVRLAGRFFHGLRRLAILSPLLDGDKALFDELFPIMTAFLISCYFVACAVMTKTMLPAHLGTAFTAALGGTLTVYPAATQIVYAASAAVSCVVLGTTLAIRRQNTHRYVKTGVAWGGKY